MNEGIYEEIVTQLVSRKLNELEKNAYYIKETKIDREEAASILSQHLSKTIKYAFSMYPIRQVHLATVSKLF